MDYEEEFARLIKSERKELLGIYREMADSGDKWSSAMELTFGVCDNVFERGGDIPSELGYRCSILGIDDDNSYYAILDGYELLTLEEVLKLMNRVLKTLKYLNEDY